MCIHTSVVGILYTLTYILQMLIIIINSHSSNDGCIMSTSKMRSLLKLFEKIIKFKFTVIAFYTSTPPHSYHQGKKIQFAIILQDNLTKSEPLEPHN